MKSADGKPGKGAHEGHQSAVKYPVRQDRLVTLDRMLKTGRIDAAVGLERWILAACARARRRSPWRLAARDEELLCRWCYSRTFWPASSASATAILRSSTVSLMSSAGSG